MVFWWVTAHNSKNTALGYSITSKPPGTKYSSMFCSRLGSGSLASGLAWLVIYWDPFLWNQTKRTSMPTAFPGSMLCIQIYQIYCIPCSSQTCPEPEKPKAKADTRVAVRGPSPSSKKTHTPTWKQQLSGTLSLAKWRGLFNSSPIFKVRPCTLADFFPRWV